MTGERPALGPQPFREFVLKVHSRCNLACDYCYVYMMADQSWRDQPRVMSSAVISGVAQRIAEHLHAHALSDATVVLHGGEPLLAGPRRIDDIVTRVRRAAGPDVRVTFEVQTNGVLLDRAYLDLFLRHGIRVGVSIDGDRTATDRHRRGADGRSSHDAVTRALRLLGQPPYQPLLAGLLCTVDLDNDPVATYEALLDHSPPMVDFLLPNGNWTYPPPQRPADPSTTPYADWLTAVFDRWYAAPRTTPVRLFDEILNLLLGGASRTESVGLSPSATVVVETDGSIEQVDSLKSAYHGAAVTGLSVLRHPFDAALDLPAIAIRRRGALALSGTCRRCAVRDVCGGGLYAHRFRAGSGFDNPSVYCPDLRRLIAHVSARVRMDLMAVTGAARGDVIA